MDDEKTRDLIALAKAGDREAFNELVRQTYQRVHALALRLTGNEHDADDVVQETYVRAFRHLRRFRGDARFSTWLHRITANNASTLLGRRSTVQRRHDHLDDVIDLIDYSSDNDPAMHAEAAYTRHRLDQAIARLPIRLRSVLELREELGLSHREIAEKLDISESAAKVRLHRARERVRTSITSLRTDGTPADSAASDAVPSDAVPSDAAPSESALSESALSESSLSESALSESVSETGQRPAS